MPKQQDAPGGLDLVREFVNTVDVGEGNERLSDPGALREWLHDRGLAPADLPVSRQALGRALELREALRSILLSHTDAVPAPADALGVLDSAACRARLRVRFHPGETGTGLEPEAAGVDGALGLLLAEVHQAIVTGTWSRLKACRDHTCAWAFYDHTKNRSGAWCNMAVCGNRAKARSYRDRHGGG